MKNILFLMADGFEETEFVTPFDYWQRASMKVCLASISNSLEVSGAHGLKIQADALLKDLDVAGFDAVFLPGGGPGVQNLLKSSLVETTVQEFYKKGLFVLAICAAPLVLSKAKILENHKATCYPGCEADLVCKEFSENRVVVDGSVVTSRGAGTAEEFAFECIALLLGADIKEKIRQQVVAR